MAPLRSLAIVLVLAVVLAASPAHAAPQLVTSSHSQTVALTLQKIFQTAFDEAFSRHAVIQRDGTTFVTTGDIKSDWLRDTSAIMKPYIGLSRSDLEVRATLRGVVARQAKYILIDPYANAFSLDYHVAERKFEMDSLLYPVWFSYLYWKATGDRSVFTPEVHRAYARVMEVLRIEQHHETRSRYRQDELANGGKGTPVPFTGLVWTAFRASDDPARYPYNIPDNMFGVVVLRDLTQIEQRVYHDRKTAENSWGLAVQIQRAIEKNGTVFLPGFGRIYAYEIDGRGHANLMDDANVPSLLSIPYFGYVGKRDVVYGATRKFVLSDRDPYYFTGKYAAGIGSPHTPRGFVWPLALVMQALTSTDPVEVDRVMSGIAASDTGDHRLHEAFNPNWPEEYTREDFAWPNALFAELMISREGHLPGMIESAR